MKDHIFYVGTVVNEDTVEWSTSNFTCEELMVIERFLKELNEHTTGTAIDGICILKEE